MLSSSRAGTAASTEGGLACVPEGCPPPHRHERACVRACIVLQTPLSPRRAMFRKESRGESRHTIAGTSNSDRWLRGVGFAVVRQLGSGPLSSHPARPMLGGMRAWRSTMPDMLLGRRVQPTVLMERRRVSCLEATNAHCCCCSCVHVSVSWYSPIRPLSRRAWQLLLPSSILVLACGLIEEEEHIRPHCACPHGQQAHV